MIQKIIITTEAEEDEILSVLQALKNGDAHISDGVGGIDQLANCTFTCEVTADGQGYLLEEPVPAYYNGDPVGYLKTEEDS
jgi:hypothetical protein